MKKNKYLRILKYFFIGLLVVLIIIQFIQPAKNNSNDQTYSIEKSIKVSDTIKQILVKSCYDCHSNNTNYPWYAYCQPFAWWLNDHIIEGKKEINFDEFSKYSIRRQYKKMNEIMEEVNENKMPLESYTWIHKNTILSENDKKNINIWCEQIIAEFKSKYPADSLKIKKKPQ